MFFYKSNLHLIDKIERATLLFGADKTMNKRRERVKAVRGAN